MKKFYTFAAAAAVALAANAQSLYITGAGDFTNGTWNAAEPDEFEIVDGKYQIEITNLTQFKISTNCDASAEDAWVPFNEGCYGCEYGDTPGVTVELSTPWEGNIVAPWKGDYKIVVAADLSTITLTTDTPKPEGGVEVYLRGGMNDWGNPDDWKMTMVKDGLYKFVFADDQVIETGIEFKLADADWNEINVGGDGTALMLDTEIEVFNGGNPANMTVEEALNGVVWFILDLDGSSYIAVSNDKEYVPDFAEDNEGDAVEIVAVENAPAVYYNLQGVRVANPTNGIYVKVAGNKATKVLVNE